MAYHIYIFLSLLAYLHNIELQCNYNIYIHIAGTYIEYVSICRVHVHCMFNAFDAVCLVSFGFSHFFYSPGTVTCRVLNALCGFGRLGRRDSPAGCR